jgi:hypothetical protein
MTSRKAPPRSVDQRLSKSLPPPRDPEVAVREEYALAIARGTDEALDFFIARHSEHRLAEQARRVLAQRRTTTPTR